ncbi:hypothetical protein HYU15_03445 [Candidatus Woesearchaeota archaeon]|nr:hypothetical protein [Candidatus Woesearchaeota archaeon]
MANARSKTAFLARAIIEVAGKPRSHIESTMRLVVEKLKTEDGIKVLSARINEPQQHEDIYSAFAEVEAELEGFESVLLLCFEYMPSSIEFIEPEETKIASLSLTEIFNDLLARLHQADMRLKDVNAANLILEKNATALLKRALTLALKEGEKTAEELSKSVGIVPEQLKPFLDRFLQERIIKQKDGKYLL